MTDKLWGKHSMYVNGHYVMSLLSFTKALTDYDAWLREIIEQEIKDNYPASIFNSVRTAGKENQNEG